MIKKKDLQDAHDAYERGDYKTAYKIILPLAEEGYINYQFNLGIMYSEGQGVPQDYDEAIKLYRLAAEQRLVNAQYKLGMMYSKGQVQHDYDEAIKWFRLAAEQGDVAAKSQLDLLLKKKDFWKRVKGIFGQSN